MSKINKIRKITCLSHIKYANVHAMLPHKKFLPTPQLYFIISTITVSIYLYDERNFLMGFDEKPTNKSFLGSTSCEFLSVHKRFCGIFMKKNMKNLNPKMFYSQCDHQYATARLFNCWHYRIRPCHLRFKERSARVSCAIYFYYDGRHHHGGCPVRQTHRSGRIEIRSNDRNYIYN